MDELSTLENAIETAHGAAVLQEGGHGSAEAVVLRDLGLRMKKLKRAWSRPQALGLFGPSQAGKSFLVGALLAHEMGSLMVKTKRADLDFLKEVNPNKGVESTGVVTRFTQRDDIHLRAVFASIATIARISPEYFNSAAVTPADRLRTSDPGPAQGGVS